MPGYEPDGEPVVSGDTTTFTNKHVLPLGELTALKVWDDHNNKDKKRFKAKLTLIAWTRDENGEAVTLNLDGYEMSRETDGGEVSWTDMPLYTEDGRVIIYTLREEGVGPDGKGKNGYTCSITGDAKTGFVVTNRRTPDPTPTPKPTPTPTPRIVVVTEPPSGNNPPAPRVTPLVEIEEPDTPLGLTQIINHVGDCFD